VVPDGAWMAITLAPETGAIWESVTMPVSEPVVTPCAAASATGQASRQTARIDRRKRADKNSMGSASSLSFNKTQEKNYHFLVTGR
jgi:hypothetical protein